MRELLKKKDTSAKLARWALCLQDYDIDIEYRSGKTNQNADCLSRIPEPDSNTKTQPEQTPVINALTTINFAEEQQKDKYCRRAREKYEKMLKMKEELINESEKEDDSMSIRDNAIDDSPQDSDQGYLTDEDNVYND